jgi:UPF0271 protein
MIDLNCDLGEGEPPQRTRALMAHLDSANIACGGHAGSLDSMSRCVRLAGEYGVRIGAHPGPGGNFGRGPIDMNPPAFALAILHQVAALKSVASAQGQSLHHVKLHGAWYHASESNPDMARAYLAVLREHFPGLTVFALAGGSLARRCRRQGQPVWEEAFADRGYLSNGQLIPRGETDAMQYSLSRIRFWLQSGLMATRTTPIRLTAQTLCVHGDTPQALAYLRRIRKLRDSLI